MSPRSSGCRSHIDDERETFLKVCTLSGRHTFSDFVRFRWTSFVFDFSFEFFTNNYPTLFIII